MMLPPLPADEDRRLDALAELEILDSDFEPVYDAIVLLAAVICEVPTASITMIDRDRQWHKAMRNIEDREAPRAITFCAHTILGDDMLVVEDATADERFHDNPLVLGRPHIRFYAGHRLLAPGGEAVGTLCVIDEKPRTLTGEQREALHVLARQAMALLELRLRSRQLALEMQLRREAERRASEAREYADAASRVKSDFLARMSHELRTPLNSVIGFSRVLGRNRLGTLNESDVQYVARIEANGHHLLALINDLLDLAKVEAGRLPVDLSPGSLGLLIRETVSAMQRRLLSSAGEDPVELVADVPEGLSEIETDWIRLRQVLVNLVGNALKFTERGSVTVRVIAGREGGHRPVRIDVVDTGIGIPADRREAIFDAFEQASRETSDRYGGTGLGLSISQGIAETLGYRITVESAVGEGSTFSLHLG
jgi:signal transduction histidine kinase